MIYKGNRYSISVCYSDSKNRLTQVNLLSCRVMFTCLIIEKQNQNSRVLLEFGGDMKYNPMIKHLEMQRVIEHDANERQCIEWHTRIKEINRIKEYKAKREAYDRLN